LAKKRIAVELHNFKNSPEKVNQFNAVSGGFPTIETTSIQVNIQYTAPERIEGE
jgi:hypothetical protein